MLNEEVDQLAAIPHLDHFDHFVGDHRTQRHERKHKKEYLMMTNTQKHLLFILFSTRVCVWSILELLDPIYQGIYVPWKAHGKHICCCLPSEKRGDTWTCSHHPVQGGESFRLKVGLHLMLTD
jgi:hypothetical protein